MIGLALTSVRHRAAAVAATLVAVLLGVALLVASGGIFATALRLDTPPQRLAGAPVVVAGPETYQFPNHSGSATLPEQATLRAGLASQVADVDEVGHVVADTSFPAVLLTADGPFNRGDSVMSGHPWTSAQLTPYTLNGQPPTTTEQVVIDTATARRAGAGIGSQVRLAVDGEPGTYTITGIAHPSHPVDTSALFFSDAHGHGPTALGVFPVPGTSPEEAAAALHHLLPDSATVLTGTSRGKAEFPGIGGVRLSLIILAAVFGGLVIVVMGIVVAATTTLSMRRRHRELALLRATGATGYQVGRLVLAEAMVVAVVGAAGGSVLGGWVGDMLLGQLRTHQIVPTGLTYHQGLIPHAAAAVIGLGAVWIATRLASRSAQGATPIEALRAAELPSVDIGPLRRALAGILAVGTVGLAVTTVFMSPTNASALGGPGVLTGSVAVALIGPELVRRLGARYTRLRRARRHSDATGSLAAVNLRARAVQYGAVLTPITIATAICLGNVYSQTTQEQAAQSAYLGRLDPDVVVTSQAGGVPAGLVDRLADLPSVTTVSEMTTSHGWLEEPFDASHTSDPLPLLGLSTQPRQAPVYTGKVSGGALTALRPGTVAVPDPLAEDLNIDLGNTVTIRLGDGSRINPEVVALLDQPSGYQQLLLPAKTLTAHTTTRLPAALLVRTDDPDAVTQTVHQQLPHANVGGGELLRARFDTGLGVQAWVNYLIALLALAYAAIATINTLAVSIIDRRREFGLQRLTGATRREVTRVLRREVLLVTALGYLAGAGISILTIWPITIASGRWLPTGPPWVLLASVVAVLLLTLPVTETCARLTMRQRAASAAATPQGMA